jgi:uroporphyrinogen decarboxylase
MTGEERFLSALKLEEPDTVPTFTKGMSPQAILRVARELMSGVPDIKVDLMSPLREDENEVFMDLFMRIHEELDIDGYSNRDVGLLYWGAGLNGERGEIVDDLHVRDSWGIVYQRSPHGIPVPVHHPVRTFADLNRLSAAPTGGATDLVRAGAEQFKGRKALVGDVLGPYTVAWFLRGSTELLLDLIDAPDFAHGAMRFATDAAKEKLRGAVEVGMRVVTVNDDVAHAHGPIMSPRQYREFIAPCHREIVEFGQSLGLKMVLHADGNLWALLDDIVGCGFEGLHPLQPDADMDLARVKESVGNRLCLIGNLSVTDLLPSGSPRDVEAAVIGAVRDASRGGGYILSDSNVITPAVNATNFITMMLAAKQHGGYGDRKASIPRRSPSA